MSTGVTAHIEIDDDGVAWIDDTNVKVIEVALDKLAHGSSPEEMHFQYPHLSLAQIHAALAYYYDHQAEMDAEIRTRWAEADNLAAQVSDENLRQKLANLKNTANKQSSPRSYRRKKGSDTWHWCTNCHTWPASDYEEKPISSRPTTGEFCNECQAKARSGNCQTWL
jgi:uncharacterized protein (DUF433 family)